MLDPCHCGGPGRLKSELLTEQQREARQQCQPGLYGEVFMLRHFSIVLPDQYGSAGGRQNES
jgi:hypothetical protein